MNAQSTKPIRYLSIKDIALRHGRSPATIWRCTAAREFPQPVKLSPGCTRWKLSDIEKWENDREGGNQK